MIIKLRYILINIKPYMIICIALMNSYNRILIMIMNKLLNHLFKQNSQD